MSVTDQSFLRPVDRRYAVAPQVYSALREAIVTLALAPGQRLSEKDLAARLGVSRTPVRDAFLRLAGEDLIEAFPQSGTVVTCIDLGRAAEAQFVRETLECAIVRQVAEVIDVSGQDRLRSCIDEQQRAADANDADRFYSLDEDFHRSLSEIAGLSHVWKVCQAAKVHLDRIRRLSLPLPSKIDELVRQHNDVVVAICGGDVKRAEASMSYHQRALFRDGPVLAQQHPQLFTVRSRGADLLER